MEMLLHGFFGGCCSNSTNNYIALNGSNYNIVYQNNTGGVAAYNAKH